MDYLSAVTELNYMTQIVIMLYEDNDKVSRELRLVFCSELCHFGAACLYVGRVCVVGRSPPRRSVSTLSCTSVQESKDVRMKRTCLWASAFAQPPLRCENVCLHLCGSWLVFTLVFILKLKNNPQFPKFLPILFQFDAGFSS